MSRCNALVRTDALSDGWIAGLAGSSCVFVGLHKVPVLTATQRRPHCSARPAPTPLPMLICASFWVVPPELLGIHGNYATEQTGLEKSSLELGSASRWNVAPWWHRASFFRRKKNESTSFYQRTQFGSFCWRWEKDQNHNMDFKWFVGFFFSLFFVWGWLRKGVPPPLCKSMKIQLNGIEMNFSIGERMLLNIFTNNYHSYCCRYLFASAVNTGAYWCA